MKKVCIKCNILKSLNNFYKHPKMKDGYLNKCKSCCKIDCKNNYEKNIKYYKKYEKYRNKKEDRKKMRLKYMKKIRKNYPIKYNARTILNNAIRDKKIKKKLCIVCKSKIVQGHHFDYKYPLCVLWICEKHHKKLHKIENNNFRIV